MTNDQYYRDIAEAIRCINGKDISYRPPTMARAIYALRPAEVCGTAPLTVNNAENAPLIGLTLYGKCTQHTAAGHNLFNAGSDGVVTRSGLTVALKDGQYRITGIAETALVTVGDSLISGSVGSIVGQVIFTSNVSGSKCVSAFIRAQDREGDTVILENGVAADVDITGGSLTIEIAGLDVGTEVDVLVSPMLNLGDEPLPWEIYTSGQTAPSPEYQIPVRTVAQNGSLTVTVSDGGEQERNAVLAFENGLLGIPVDSGGNYTDKNGQHWVCDTVEYQNGEGVLARRVYRAELDSSYDWEISTKFIGSAFCDLSSKMGIQFPAGSALFCSHAIWTGTSENYAPGMCYMDAALSLWLRSEPITKDEFDEWIDTQKSAGTPVTVYLQMSEPQTILLSRSELVQFNALRTYKRKTVIDTVQSGVDFLASYTKTMGA